MSDSEEELWYSDSDSEDYVDRMFDPDYYNPADHEDVAFNIGSALEFWGRKKDFWGNKKKGTVIRDVFANSIKSLEMKEASEPRQLLEIIRIVIDMENKILSFVDNGVGMTRDELERYGSGGDLDLFSVADKVVVTTKHDKDYEYVMVLSPEEKKIDVVTQEDQDLLFREKRRGTKITFFLKKQDEFEHLLDFTTYRVLADMCFSTKIKYRIYMFSKDGDDVTVTGFVPNSNSLFEGSYQINKPINFLRRYTLPQQHLLQRV